jgi:hypothetical protein
MINGSSNLRLRALGCLLALGAAPACEGGGDGAILGGEEAAVVPAATTQALSSTVALGGPDTLPIRLEIAGITPDQKSIIGGFKTLSGMDSETEVIELDAGEVTDGTSLRAWAAQGARRGGSIIVYDWEGKNVMAQYRLTGARPVSLATRGGGEVLTGDGASTAMAIEKIEIANEKVERVLR